MGKIRARLTMERQLSYEARYWERGARGLIDWIFLSSFSEIFFWENIVSSFYYYPQVKIIFM